jgi:hypothetical protein
MYKNNFIMRVNDSYYKWPGFYIGVTNRFTNKYNTLISYNSYFPIWIIPKLSKQYTINDSKNIEAIILSILNSNNISLYDDIQLNISNLEEKDIYKINPYDTRIIKPFLI